MKETIAGQVYVRTRGGETIKLSAVPVMLLDRQKAEDHVAKMSSKLTHQRNEQQARLNGINREIESLESQIKDNVQHRDRIATAMNRATIGLEDLHRAARNSRLTASQRQQISEVIQESNSSIDTSKENYSAVMAKLDELNGRLRVEKAARDELQARLIDVQAELFKKPWPVIELTTTDADGNYSFQVLSRSNLVVVGSAGREMFKGEESYYWLVDVNPAGPVHLNNSNVKLGR